MNDPLAQFRRKPPATAAGTAGATGQTPPPKGPDGYVAFDTKDRVARLKIFKKNYPTHTPGYHYLLDVVYSGQNVTQIVLVFTFLMVFIKGKNLQPIVSALELGTADFIREFDPATWPKPDEPQATVIENIKIAVKENGPGPSEADGHGIDEPGLSLH
jgi:hypothetical protein